MANFWDWFYIGIIFITDYSIFFILIMLVAGLLSSLISTSHPGAEIEKEPPKIPEGADAREVDRNSRWLKYYLKHYKFYPRNGCTYFWKSLLLIVHAALMVIFTIAILPILMLAILCFMFLIFSIFTKFPALLFVFILSYYHYIIAIVILAGVIYKFFTSRAFEAAASYIKSVKEKRCLPIRYK